MKKLIPVIIIILTISILCILYVYRNTNKQDDRNINNEIKTDENNIEQKNEEIIEKPIQYIEYSEKPADETDSYFEKIIQLEGQYTYYSHPLKVEKDKKVRLIVYSHGSNTTVSNSFNTQFMKDLQKYGNFFSKKGYAFIASNQHGANYGNDASIQDIENSIKYMRANYLIEDKVYHIGFSMGGLPAIYHSMKYNKSVGKLALLAPVTYSTSWKNQNKLSLLKPIDIKIWHGDKDVNVPYSASQDFIKDSKQADINIVLETLNNKTHWDVDTELMKEILEFYEQ